jgi:hypothetical protein
MQDRHRFKQAQPFQDRLSELAADVREKISSLPHGPERHAILKTIWQADDAAKLEKWANSPGLQPPK